MFNKNQLETLDWLCKNKINDYKQELKEFEEKNIFTATQELIKKHIKELEEIDEILIRQYRREK